MLKRLAVFRGGFEREAAAQVAGASLPVLLGLLSKSLLRRDAAGRYDMHELVRQFAAEKLAGEDRAVASQQHAHFYLALVKQAEPELHGADQVAWRQRLEHELDNLRTALTWAIENQESEICLELAIGLGWFWFIGGHLIEGGDWLTKILALPDPDATRPLRAKALNVAGLLAFYHADYAASSKAYQESIAISEAIADRATLADALHGLGNSFWYQGSQTEAVPLLEKSLALYTGLADQAGVAASLSRLGAIASYRDEHDIALSLSERSLAIYKTLDDKRGMIYTLCNLAEATMYKQHAYEAACSLYEQCLSIAREVQDKPGIAAVLFSLADLALARQDYLQAETYAHEALALAQQLGDPWQPPRMMRLLGYAALQRGDIAQATALFVESIFLNQKLEDQRGVIASLAAMASVAAAQQQFEIAAHRLAMVQAVLATLKDPLLPADRVMYDQTIAATRAKLSPEQFDAAWAEGARLTLEQEIESALAPYEKKPR
jgi:tetratricopeptide (TPR) repeat protein